MVYPLEGKLSFPSLILLCIMLIYSVIIANEKCEFNKQDMLFEFSHILYQICIGDKSFVSSVDEPDS